MGYCDDVDKVEQYTKMCKDYDGAPLYDVLRRHLVQGSSLLELGCGPGFDIQVLQHEYRITASDLSLAFLVACQQRVLSGKGYIAHSFWLGDRTEEMYGLSFLYHGKEVLLALIERYFKVLKSYAYGEFEGGDSLFVVAQKR